MFLFLLIGALEWTETSFADFRDGVVDPMCYVSYREQFEDVQGCVEFYARWDADNNGFYDLFIAGRQSYGQKLFMGQFGGSYDLDHTITFLDCQPYSGDASGGIDMADLNMDGYPEAIHSGGWYSPAAYLYWGDVSGPNPAFKTLLPMRTSYGNCHETAFVYDIDKDGYLDITICGGTGSPSQNYTRIFWGNESFAYGTYTELPSGIGCQHNLEMADLDHDGWVETVIPNYGTSNASIVHWDENRVYTIQTLSLSQLGGVSLHGTTLADFNHDEWLDIVFTGYSDISKALIYWGSEDGFSLSNTTLLNPGTCYGGSSSMDIDADGDLDLIFHRNGGSTTYPRLYLNFAEAPYFKDSNHPDTCRNLGNIPVNGTGGFTADLNFDGYLDIFLNAHQSGSPFGNRSPILWGPNYTTATFLVHDGFDHHGVFREPGNVYDRSFTAWYYSSIFDCTEEYDGAKNARLSYIGYEPTGSYIDFSVRSGPDSVPSDGWTNWDRVENGYGDPQALRWRFVQYRAEFHYSKPCYLPWLEEVGIQFTPIDFELKLWPDSVKNTTPSNYVDYFTKLYYRGDERDSFYILVRNTLQPGWWVQLWDTAYIDTIPFYFKLDAIQPQGEDTVFYTRIYAPADAQVGDSNVTILYTKTHKCSRDMDDSVRLVTYVVSPGVLETRLVEPITLDVSGVDKSGSVRYTLPAGEKALLSVYDPSGRRVFAREVEGSGQLQWADKAIAAGLYFVKLECASAPLARKVVLMR